MVLVAEGTYAGYGNKELDFMGKAITVMSEQGSDFTVIDCENSGRGFYFHANESANTIVKGFEIRNGGVRDYGGCIYCSFSYPTIENCTITGNSAYDGGGIYCSNSAPTIIKCTINGNSAIYNGAGIYCEYSSPTITDCTISGNNAKYGGGIYCYDCSDSSPTIINCTITENTACYGGGIQCYSNSAPTIINCTITGNSAIYNGAGIYCEYSSPTITDCIIYRNNAKYGGGIYCYNCSNAFPTIINCTITENTAGYGGGIQCYFGSAPTIIKCTINGNSAIYNGAGIYCEYSSPTITDCTISGNDAKYGGGIYCYDCYNSSPTIKNSILWDNLPDEIYESYSNLTVLYSDIEGDWKGTGNINLDPLFVEPGNYNYYLQKNSPCIDMGDPTSIIPFGGGCRIDMGAYEFYKGFNCQGEIIPAVKSKTRF